MSRRVATSFLIVVFGLSVFGLASTTSAQILDLDGAPEFPEMPVSVLDEIARSLTTDLPQLDLETETGIVRSAATTLRRVIAELANRGRGSDPGDAASALAAIRLASAIEGITDRLDRLAIPGAFTGHPPLRLDDTSRRRGLDRLATFARSALDELRRRPTDSLAEFDDTVSLVLAPIVDAIEILERRTLMNRWPSDHEVRTAGRSPMPAALPPLPDRPGLEVVDRALREDVDPESRRLHRRFREAAARIVTLDADGPAREPLIVILDDLPQRNGAEARRAAIETLDVASRIAENIGRIAASTARRDADPQVLADLLASTCDLDGDPRTLALLSRQAMVTGLIADGGLMNVEATDRTLRQAARAVQQRHRRLVRAMVVILIRIGRDPSALGDPAAVAALQALEQSLLDLDRLRTAGTLSSRMTAIRPGAVREFEARIRTWCGMLGNDATRAEGADAIEAVSRDLDRFMPFPGESWLAAGGPTVAARTGGRGTALLERASETRRRWADEISHGDLDGPARSEMRRIARLGTLLLALDAILGPDDASVAGGLAICDLWGGWYVSPDRFEWTARTLAPSLRVAAVAAADGDVDRLDRDLDRLESAAPPAMVVHWLGDHIGPPLQGATSGAVGLLAATALPPGEDAWSHEHRDHLARICRGFAEIEAARRRDDQDLVKRLTDWTVQACDDLLDRVRMIRPDGRRRGAR